MVGTILKTDLQSTIEDQLQGYARGLGTLGQQAGQQIGDTFEDLQRAGRTKVEDVQAQLSDYATQAFNATLEAQRQAQEQTAQREQQMQQVGQQLSEYAAQALQPPQQPEAPAEVPAGAPAALPQHAPSPPVQTDGTQIANAPSAGGQVFPLPIKPDNAPSATYHSQGGTDLMAPRGTPVLNMQNGTVQEVFTDNGSHQVGGNAVLIHGDDGLDYYYAHFDQPSSTKVGQRVSAGEQIGAVGNSGNAYKDGSGATHLHLGIGHGISNGVGSEGGLGQNFNAQSLLSQLQEGVGKAASTAQDVVSKIPAPSQVADYIRYAAAQRGIDPETAVRVAQSEGLNTYTGDQGSSFGPFQLHMGGLAPRGSGNEGAGLGDAFKQATGLDPRDPSSWKQQVDYALSSAANSGWGPWHGAQRIGVGAREGIGTFKGNVEEFAQGAQNALQAAGSAIGGAVAGARRAAGDVIQAGEPAPTAAKAPIYGTNEPAGGSPMQQLTAIQSQLDALRNQLEPYNKPPLAGAPEAAGQAVGGAFNELGTRAQQANQDISTAMGGNEPAYMNLEPSRGGGAVLGQRPPAFEPGSVAGQVESGQRDVRDLGFGEGLQYTGQALGAGLQALPDTYRALAGAKRQAIEENNPLRDVFFAGGATSMLADAVTDPVTWVLPWGRVGTGATEILSQVPRFRGVGARVTGEALMNGLQNAAMEMAQPDASPERIGQAFGIGAGFGAVVRGAQETPAARAVGRYLLDQRGRGFPVLQQFLRDERGELRVGGEPPEPAAAPEPSGRQGGEISLPFATNLTSGALGGYAGNLATPSDASPEERARNIAAGAATGLAAGHLINRIPLRGAPELAGRGREPFRAPPVRAEFPDLRATTQGPPGGPPVRGGGGGGSSPELDRLNSMYEGKKPAPTSSIPDRLQAVGDSLTRMFTDRQVDINRAQERYAANLGRPLRGDEMAAELQRLASDPVAQVKVDEGLKPAIQSVGADYPALRNYVTLRSNVEVADALAARTGKPEVGTDRLFSGGLNRADSLKALEDLETQLGPARFARVEAAADQVTAFNQMLRQRLVDAQVLDSQTAAGLDAQYPNWAKTRILDYMADPTGGQGAGTKLGLSDRGLREYTLTGTERAREDPIASTVAYAHQVERMAMKNEAFNAFLQIDQGSTSPMLRQVPQSYTPKSNEVTMIGFVNGEKQKFVTDNKALGAAINGAGVLATPEWTSAWQKIFRSLATSRNPLFLAGNAALDIPTYVLRESVREGGPQALPRVLSELARGYGDAFQGLFQGEFRGGATARFLKGGGGQAGFFTGGEGQSKQAIAELQRKHVFQISGSADLGRLTKDLLTLHPVEVLGERIELGPRVAAMRLAERRGANPTQAIIDGRTVTVDFSQGGTVTKYLNNFIPFFNVGFQGPAQVARAFRDNPRAWVATVGTLIGLPAAAAEVWNRSDPQRAQDYADVPQYIKDQGVVIMLPGETPVDKEGNRKPLYALIKLREWAPFAAAAREATARVMGDDSRSWQEMASSIGSGLSPIQAQSAAQVGTEPLAGIPILPAAAQLQMNTDFFRGRTIVSERADENASALAKSLTPMIQGVLDRAGINAEVRPSAIDFLVRNQGAGVGGAALAASDLIAGEPSDRAGPTGVPVVGGLAGRFVGNQTGDELQQARTNTLTPEARQTLRSNGITLTPGPVSKTINQIPLLIPEQTRYQQLTNRYIDEAIARTAASSDFASKTQVGKQSLMDQAMQAARQKAGLEVLNTIPAAEKQRRLKTKSTAPSAA